MNGFRFTATKKKSRALIALAFLLVFVLSFNASAQYRGAPVKKDRLLKALRSKQFQTRDIVTIINQNGVDFKLTPADKNILIAAGARPEVIKAVSENPRLASNSDTVLSKSRKSKPAKKPVEANYEDLLDQAMFAYKDQKNPRRAAQVLGVAVKMNPKNPVAYQMLGFVNLYGLNDAAAAEKLMREAIDNGGSAVFRVYHDDSGSFSGRCTGSLYISPDSIRFESDDNRHTFETAIGNIDKFRLDTESNRAWKKYPIFKVLLKIGKSDIKFRFAPVTGKTAETQMVERFVYTSKNNIGPSATAASFQR